MLAFARVLAVWDLILLDLNLFFSPWTCRGRAAPTPTHMLIKEVGYLHSLINPHSQLEQFHILLWTYRCM
jgi:hypothetical protein